MATSARAQELADQLLDLEAMRGPLPAESRRFKGMNEIKAFVRAHKKAVMVVGVIAGALILYAGYKEYQKNRATK